MKVHAKLHKILSVFLLFFLFIFLRVWHLGVVQKNTKQKEAIKPQQRTLLLKADRGPIYDRFGIPLALNKICYNAAIYYAQIAEIPRVRWVDGQKRFARKEYIQNLSTALAKTLNLDADRVEDLIHSKAALFPHVPFILKSSLREEEHYRLKMMEKDWPGLVAEITSIRSYPQGKTACNILGTVGAISHKEYHKIAQEMSELKEQAEFADFQDLARLSELKEKAYSIHDFIGKTGVECEFEEELRGFYGKKILQVDQKGRVEKELMEKSPIAGKQLYLTISAELQQFAETLLIHNERFRDQKSKGFDPLQKERVIQKQPWIKGGAIVAIDPKTAEVLALASAPRFDPNDFIFHGHSIFNAGKEEMVNRWLENDLFIGAIWDGKDALFREELNFRQEKVEALNWERYLKTILPEKSAILTFFQELDVKRAISLQEDFEAMLYFQKAKESIPKEILFRLKQVPFSEKDLTFAVDLCRTVVYAPAFTNALIEKIGSMKIAKYFELSQKFQRKEQEAKNHERKRFHKEEFAAFRKAHQKEFLEKLRKEEKKQKRYAKPYIDYLDEKEEELFCKHWQENKFSILSSEEMPEELISTFRSFKELVRPLLGKYPKLRNFKKGQTEQDMAAAFYPKEGFGFYRSYAYESNVPPGSVFKLVTGYEALRQKKHFTLIDQVSKKGVGMSKKGFLYPRYYKNGRLPRSAKRHMGEVDLIGALEQSSNPYFSILAGDFFKDPEDLNRAAKLFGFGEKTGICLPREASGNLPNDLKTNRTGLYSTAIGQHTLLCTPLQTAMMMQTICNQGELLQPQLIHKILGSNPNRNPLSPFQASNYLAQEKLHRIGIPFPLFTAANPLFEEVKEVKLQKVCKRVIPMEKGLYEPLFKGMDAVVSSEKGSAFRKGIKALLANPLLMKEYAALEHQMIGKTGTAEIVHSSSVNPSDQGQIYKYIWFAGASLEENTKEPELVVVVFLRFGDAGKEAAPLAAQMIHKWREIKKSRCAQD